MGNRTRTLQITGFPGSASFQDGTGVIRLSAFDEPLFDTASLILIRVDLAINRFPCRPGVYISRPNSRRFSMARPRSLATLSLDALMKLRDDVTDMLGKQASAMQDQLARLTGVDVGSGRKRAAKPRVSKLKGRKATVKYRDKGGNKWSGRGAQPRWMTAAIKAGAKRDDFLVGAKRVKPAKRATKKAKSAKRKMKPAKKSRPAKRRRIQRKAAPAPTPSPEA